MVGRYLKTVKDFGYQNILKGDYYLITNKKGTIATRLKDGMNDCLVNYTDTKFYELMPEGFIPESEQSNLINNLVIW